jgi:hypothetical protein
LDYFREWFDMSGALQAAFQNLRSFGIPPNSQSYTTAGTYTWVAPTGVTAVSVVVVGGGGGGANGGCFSRGGGGGGLGYKNNVSVTPGNSYTVVVGAGGTGTARSCSGQNSGGTSKFT